MEKTLVVAERLVTDRGWMEQPLPQEVQLAFMTLQRRVVELEKEALTKNGVNDENLQNLISESSWDSKCWNNTVAK